MAKKLILLIVAFSLIMACMVSFGLTNDASVADAGLGIDTSIRNMSNLSELTEGLEQALSSNVKNNGTISLNTSKYRSATIHINHVEKFVSTSSNFKATNGNAAENRTIESELTCYIVEGGIYYETQHLSYNRETRYVENDNGFSEQRNFYTFVKYNVDIYIKTNTAYIKINEYNVANGDTATIIKGEYIDKWIEVPVDIAYSFTYVRGEAYEQIAGFNSTMDVLFKAGSVELKDKSFSFNASELARIYTNAGKKSSIDPNTDTAEFGADLTDPSRPAITIASSYEKREEIENTVSSAWGWEKVNSVVNTECQFVTDVVIYNVNNTTIDKPGAAFADARVTSIEEFDNLFVIKGYKEN